MATWALSRSDTFNRANSALNGSTMSDGIGTWSGDAQWTILSNQAKATAAATVVDSSQTLTDCKVEFKYVSGSEQGHALRYSYASGNGYVTYIVSSAMRIYRVAGGALTLLDNSGAAISANDIVSFSVEGTTLTTYINGVQDRQVTDATYASGNAGLYAGAANGIVDDWNLYVPSTSGSPGTSFSSSGFRNSSIRGRDYQ